MAVGADEIGFWQKVALGVWAVLVTVGSTLISIIWAKHNKEIEEIKAGIKRVGTDMDDNVKFLDQRIDAVERNAVPNERYEQNRKEVREGQIETFRRLDTIGQALARIEGKLDK